MQQGRPSDLPGAGAAPGDAGAPGRPGAPDPAGPGAGAPLARLRGEAVPRVAARCAWQVVEGEAVLLDVHGRRIMGLNPVGSFVFGRVDGVRSVDAISGEVAARFRVAEERARADVAAFLGELATRGLLEEGRP
jgi:hypothetical protein